jgi:ATP-dependent RNA helicase DDX55/SPB4
MARAGKWSSLSPPLSPGVLKTLTEELKFGQMTPVQAATLPLFLKNADVAVEVWAFLLFII